MKPTARLCYFLLINSFENSRDGFSTSRQEASDNSNDPTQTRKKSIHLPNPYVSDKLANTSESRIKLITIKWKKIDSICALTYEMNKLQ
jgi:hypothetical protein